MHRSDAAPRALEIFRTARDAGSPQVATLAGWLGTMQIGEEPPSHLTRATS